MIWLYYYIRQLDNFPQISYNKKKKEFLP